MLPMLLGEGEEGHHPVPVSLERFDGLGLGLREACAEGVALLIGFSPGLGVGNPTEQLAPDQLELLRESVEQ